MQYEYTTDAELCQAGFYGAGYELDERGRITKPVDKKTLPLSDIGPNGKPRPWRKHKQEALMLSEVYAAMGESGAEGAARWLDKARRLESCASYAEFSRLPDGQGLHLYQSSFCRVRLCPMCQWRRSLKLGAQVRRVVERANADHIADTGAAWRWLMVTFTIKNVQGPELGATIDRVHKGLNNLAKCKRWKSAVRGWLRATEVTHNTNPSSVAYDTYHPHMHLLLCVPAAYFKGKGYIRQKEWADLWGHYIKANYTPVVDVRVIKPEDGGRLSDLPVGEQAAAMGKACAEVSKYAAKPADYIVPSDLLLSMQTVQVLDSMLDRRRMTSWGGILKDIAKALDLDDPETGDLVHIDDEASADQTAEEIADYIAYNWAMGARNYLPVGERRGLSERAERAEQTKNRQAIKSGRSKSQRLENEGDWWTVENYLDMHSFDKGVRRAAVDDLRHLPRVVIEQRLQSVIDDIPEGWDDDKET